MISLIFLSSVSRSGLSAQHGQLVGCPNKTCSAKLLRCGLKEFKDCWVGELLDVSSLKIKALELGAKYFFLVSWLDCSLYLCCLSIVESSSPGTL